MNLTTEEIIKVFERLGEAKVINDHTGEKQDIDGFVELNNGELAAIISKDVPYYSLNELYLGSDNIPHISTSSVGGVVQGTVYRVSAENLRIKNQYIFNDKYNIQEEFLSF